jgi:hypothetical protein
LISEKIAYLRGRASKWLLLSKAAGYKTPLGRPRKEEERIRNAEMGNSKALFSCVA